MTEMTEMTEIVLAQCSKFVLELWSVEDEQGYQRLGTMGDAGFQPLGVDFSIELPRTQSSGEEADRWSITYDEGANFSILLSTSDGPDDSTMELLAGKSWSDPCTIPSSKYVVLTTKTWAYTLILDYTDPTLGATAKVNAIDLISSSTDDEPTQGGRTDPSAGTWMTIRNGLAALQKRLEASNNPALRFIGKLIGRLVAFVDGLISSRP